MPHLAVPARTCNVALATMLRIPRSREGSDTARDDDEQVDDLVLRIAVVVLAVSFAAWVFGSVLIVVGRLRYERIHRDAGDRPLSKRQADRLVKRAGTEPRTEWGR